MTATGAPTERNTLDMLRFSLAAIVVVAHASELSGFGVGWLANVISPTMAVQGFFVISGFLIFQSYERSSSLASYASKRLRRIYPAYVFVVLACGLGLFLVSTLPAADYFTSPTLARYLVANLTFLNFIQPTLPGVFEQNPIPIVDGALWTLKIEVMFYAAVPAVVWTCRKWGPLPVLAAIYLLSVIYWSILVGIAARTGNDAFRELARQLPGQMSYFIAGAAVYYYFGAFKRRSVALAIAAAVLFGISFFFAGPLLRPAALGILVMFFAFRFYVGNFGRYGDLSYGVYILHFPILQLLIHLRVFRDNPAAFFASAAVLILVAAFLLWHLLEKGFLRRDSHYRLAEKRETATAAVGQPKDLPVA